jgi:UDP-3-O-[3-hydroxymyristoyl] N-acetylglucosamine deacetylase
MKPGGPIETVRQRTLKNSIHCSGVGLHSGAKATMMLRPAPAGTGIRFLRSDIAGNPEIDALWNNAIDTPLCTSIANGDGVQVARIEHLMSALYGCGIDNAIVELEGQEVPAMDGSAGPFVFLIECAGAVEQKAPRRALRLLKRVGVLEGGRSVSLSPSRRLSIDFEIDFGDRTLAQQQLYLEFDAGAYKRDVARARTFGFLEDIDRLQGEGQALGGSLDNAVVIDGDRVLNEGGLRFANEFVRHKVLDLIGNLYLAGGPVIAHARAACGDHALTLRLLKALFADVEAWCWIDAGEANTDPAALAETGGRKALAASA